MKLRTVTFITICGLSVGLLLNLARVQWNHLLQFPQVVIPHIISIICLQGVLLFFFVHIYRKGKE
mgnify:CR=1 FL=1